MGDRIKILVKEVKDQRVFNDKPVLDFMGLVDGKSLRYSVWEPKLFTAITKDALLDAEVVIKQSEKTDPDGNPYINRHIVNVYVDGKPVIQAPQGRGGYPGKSPEQLALERASIESQTCYNGIIKLMEVKVLGLEHEMSKLALGFAKKRLA